MKKDLQDICITDTKEYKEGYKQAIKDVRTKVAEEANRENCKTSGLTTLQRIVAYLYEA